jgi:hypothetical protein
VASVPDVPRFGRPPMTNDQRTMAVTLLANAIRKAEHRRGTDATSVADTSLPAIGARARRDASAQYVRGMRDLLGVLFAGGRAAADECYEAALLEAGRR